MPLSPLLRLLCAVGRDALTDADREAIADALIDPELPVDALPLAFAIHGLTPLAFRHLVAHTGIGLPAEVATSISAGFRRHAARQTQFIAVLRRVVAAFDAAGIDIRPYKGPVLAKQLYGHHAMRQYEDLDLLVGPAHAEPALRLLQASGVVYDDGVAPAWNDYLRRTRHARALRDRRTGIGIELHWNVVDRLHGLQVSTEWLMQAPERVDLAGCGVKAISGERLFLALCVHGAAHQWSRLCWVADVAQMIRSQPGLDWELIAGEAARLRFVRPMATALTLARELFGDAPAEPWRTRLAPDEGASAVAARVGARLCLAVPSELTLMERFRLGWLARDAWAQRAAFSWRVASHLSPKDLIDTACPPWLSPALVLRRTVRFVRAAMTGRSRAMR